jgi:hypothetical protein
MRKETKNACRALINNGQKNSGNTTIKFDKEGNGYLLLFGNTIAKLSKDKKRVAITNCGWFSITTKDRLNGLLRMLDIDKGIQQIKGKWYINSYEYTPSFKIVKQTLWDGSWIEFETGLNKNQ